MPPVQCRSCDQEELASARVRRGAPGGSARAPVTNSVTESADMGFVDLALVPDAQKKAKLKTYYNDEVVCFILEVNFPREVV